MIFCLEKKVFIYVKKLREKKVLRKSNTIKDIRNNMNLARNFVFELT